jgi:hypothetical protein
MFSFKRKAAAMSFGILGALAVPLLTSSPAMAASGTGGATFSNCTNGGGSASCTINDVNGIRRVRVVDVNTGQVLGTVGGHCNANYVSNQTVTVNNVPEGDTVRFVAYDCFTNASQAHTVSPDVIGTL